MADVLAEILGKAKDALKLAQDELEGERVPSKFYRLQGKIAALRELLALPETLREMERMDKEGFDDEDGY